MSSHHASSGDVLGDERSSVHVSFKRGSCWRSDIGIIRFERATGNGRRILPDIP